MVSHQNGFFLLLVSVSAPFRALTRKMHPTIEPVARSPGSDGAPGGRGRRQRREQDERAHASLDLHQPAGELCAARARDVGFAEASWCRELEQQDVHSEAQLRGGSKPSGMAVAVAFPPSIRAPVSMRASYGDARKGVDSARKTPRLNGRIAGNPAAMRDCVRTNWSGPGGVQAPVCGLIFRTTPVSDLVRTSTCAPTGAVRLMALRSWLAARSLMSSDGMCSIQT